MKGKSLSEQNVDDFFEWWSSEPKDKDKELGVRTSSNLNTLMQAIEHERKLQYNRAEPRSKERLELSFKVRIDSECRSIVFPID